MKILISALFLSMMTQAGCSSVATRENKTAQHSIRQLIPFNIHVRRPAGPVVDPNVGPGGPDYQSAVPPNEHYDCEPVRNLYRDISIPKLRTCMASLKQEVPVLYRLKRDPAPYLELDDVEGTPACLREVMPRILLPREIFFQSNEEGPLSCYASRLDIEADELFWVKVPKARAALKLNVPSAVNPKASDEEIQALFLSWIVAPFRDASGRIPSKIVPDVFCSRCMGEANLVREGSSSIVLWP